MSDLALSYFSQDLSDAEFEALGQSLAQDPAAALRFAKEAERDYQRLGLPEALPPVRSSRKLALLWCLAGLTVLGAAWGLKEREREVVPMAQVEAVLPLKAPVQAPAKAASTLSVQALGARAFSLTLEPRPQGRLNATVRDAKGRSVAELGASAGVWAWDCRLDDGSLAPAGRYEIRVLGSAGRWSQWVEIRRD